ncbi:ABC transporter permease [Sanguibacter sp. 25GB23B1]|uniref:ABC transporter permease n=1 Tax=unclassified Sanguibacter TaxID=2645534 RepID=UPI0032AF364C
MSTSLAGMPLLFGLALRRDRWRLLSWVGAVTLLVVTTYTAYEGLFPDPAAIEAMATSMGSNPAFALLLGQAHDLTTAGGFTAWRAVGIASLFLSLMAIFTVVRHTRAEEDAGRTELVASGVVGRHAPLAAATSLAIGACAVTGLAAAAGLVAASAMSGQVEVGGAVAIGLALATTGAVLAGVAAVAAQVGSTARAASSLAGATLGALYVLRGWSAASGSAEWAQWLSPFGWGEQILPYVENRWWVVVLPVVATIGLLAGAHALQARRDVGAGLLAQRPGPAGATSSLGGPFALAWRLHRGPFLGWLVAFMLLGALYGSFGSSVGDAFSDNEYFQRVLALTGRGGASFTLGFLATILSVMATIATIHGIQGVLRGRTEEEEGRGEPVLATPVTRTAFFASHVLAGLLGSATILLVGTAVLAVVTIATVPSGTVTAGQLMLAGLVQVPAMWVVVGVAAALFGLRPRSSHAAWVVLAVTFVLTLLGPLLGLPDAALNLSAFSHVPGYPLDPLRAAPLVWLSVTASALLVAGLVGFRRRDTDER